MDWYVGVIKKYATFDGRARRQEYWMFFLVSTVISMVLSMADGVMTAIANGMGGSSDIRLNLLGSLYGLFVLVPSLAVGVRRLHDTGRSGWWLLLAIVPLVNIVLLFFFVQAGVTGPNEYGPDPKGGYAPVAYGVAPAAVATAPAGWLPDPTGRHQMRYWDAARWTEHVSDNGVAAVDPV